MPLTSWTNYYATIIRSGWPLKRQWPIHTSVLCERRRLHRTILQYTLEDLQGSNDAEEWRPNLGPSPGLCQSQYTYSITEMIALLVREISISAIKHAPPRCARYIHSSNIYDTHVNSFLSTSICKVIMKLGMEAGAIGRAMVFGVFMNISTEFDRCPSSLLTCFLQWYVCLWCGRIALFDT